MCVFQLEFSVAFDADVYVVAFEIPWCLWWFFICFCCYWKSDYASCIKIISLQSMWCLVSFSSIIEHFLNACILVCWSFCLNNNKPFCFKYKINISKQFVSHFLRIWRFDVQKIETIQRLTSFPLHILVVGYLASRI